MASVASAPVAAAKAIVALYFSDPRQAEAIDSKLGALFGSADYLSPPLTVPNIRREQVSRRPELALYYRLQSYTRLCRYERMVSLLGDLERLARPDLSPYVDPNGKAPLQVHQVRLAALGLGNLVTYHREEASGRVYLYHGVYAQPQLVYEGGRWREHEWSDPEWRNGPALDFVTRVRAIYKAQLALRYGRDDSPPTEVSPNDLDLG